MGGGWVCLVCTVLCANCVRRYTPRTHTDQGHPPIDWDDEKERSRYGLNDEEVARIKVQLAS